ncbi:hypothetical protein Tco_0877095 [Tanacetum coccineum]|uniref:Uncharacterized protein n=1 Tax=Tanacetum coccineum TaxID=301880 RepID=A0ABQ5BZF7_9ASTR
MMNMKCNQSKGDMKVEAKSSSSGSCGKFIEVIRLILIRSYYCFIHGYYCSTTVNIDALINATYGKLILLCCSSWMVLHGIRYNSWLVIRTVLMVDSITFGHEMVNILVSEEE